LDIAKLKLKFPDSGLGQYVNFVIPELFVEDETDVGIETDNVGFEGGNELAIMEILKTETAVPSVSVSCAVPELEKVTPNGVRKLDELIFAPVKLHETVVVADIFVMF
jgi:hypothetical protein